VQTWNNIIYPESEHYSNKISVMEKALNQKRLEENLTNPTDATIWLKFKRYQLIQNPPSTALQQSQ